MPWNILTLRIVHYHQDLKTFHGSKILMSLIAETVAVLTKHYLPLQLVELLAAVQMARVGLGQVLPMVVLGIIADVTLDILPVQATRPALDHHQVADITKDEGLLLDMMDAVPLHLHLQGDNRGSRKAHEILIVMNILPEVHRIN
jgi:hypothetical protein